MRCGAPFGAPTDRATAQTVTGPLDAPTSGRHLETAAIKRGGEAQTTRWSSMTYRTSSDRNCRSAAVTGSGLDTSTTKGYGLTYGRFEGDPSRKPQNRPVHALVWEQLIGVVPQDMELDHLCDFKTCVNPQCLEEVTPAENQRRIGDRQATCRKAGHPRTPENLYVDPKGRTRCRPCARERDRQPERLARSAERRRLKNAARRTAA